MKVLPWLVASALLVGLPAAHAQQVLAHASSAPPPPGSALPPPGINDPGEKPQSVPLPSTGIPPSIAPAARGQDGGDSTNVTTRTDASGDTIEEYRRGGQVIMVRVTPKHGVTQVYKVNSSNGSLVRDPNQGPVSPVYYDIYKWGGPKKPASSAPAGASTSGG
ncbi:MAG TPA: DUF2782 domain-containing protein [Rhodanobacteraceae bacterium]|nr:DUF2782 domain-containing protein [Rhodanobacteraceae bacterium]